MHACYPRISTLDSVRCHVGTTLGSFLIAGFLALFTAGIAGAQTLHVNYVCNGERINIESCNIRDLSDNATCMVGHPDHVMPNGLMKYTNETRGALKKLLPTCKQPSAEEIARAQAFEKKQQDLYNANEQKAMAQLQPPAAAPGGGGAGGFAGAQKPKTAEERAMARCITSGRLPASCTGNSLLGAFSQMMSQVLPGADKEAAAAAAAGPNMAGVFQGAGNWRLDFIDGGVLVNCAFLSPDQHSYSIDFKNDRTALVINTTPKPLVLTFKADGTIVGPGPLVIDGVVASGSSGGGASDTSYSHGYKDQNGLSISDGQAARSPGQVYDRTGNRVYQPENSSGGQTTFAHRRATCPALNLSSKGASVGIQTMQTDLLKTMFGGEKGAPTPPGIRMHGIFAAPTGFSVQFFPESAVLGCGPDAARAYPYSVVAEGSKAVIQIAAPDHPLKLAFNADGSLEPGSAEAYQVHGRVVTGQDSNDDFTFAPMEQSCNLARLTPSKTIPSAGGSAASVTASGGTTAGAASAGARANAAGNNGSNTGGGSVNNSGGNLSTPAAPLGNAVLTVSSGFPAQAGAMNPLAGRPYVLLRDDYDTALRKGGLTIPAGMMGQKYVGSICATRTPVCQQAMAAINTSAASAVRADASGKGVMPGVPPGTYYLMISTMYNKQGLVWGFKVELKAGVNTITLDQRNATAMN